VPEFVTRTASRVFPTSRTRAGTAVNATGLGAGLAPSGADARARANSAGRRAAVITDQSP
jgi:hypothetical protein